MAKPASAPHSNNKPPARNTLKHHQPQSSAISHALRIIYGACCLAGPLDLIDNVRRRSKGPRLRKAIRNHDTAALFDRLINDISYQGIADRVAYSYLQAHGSVTWHQISQALEKRPSCPKLSSYWAFNGCRYDKTSHTCAEPDHMDRCPLPRHDCRNGHLNQAAYSLFLFLRDLANDDLIAWIDGQFTSFNDQPALSAFTAMADSLLTPLRQIYGVSDKVLSMALSIMLLAAPKTWTRWHEVGGNMIAIDTLVHNFLHRSGILARFHSEHVYGIGCYRDHGCAAIIRQIAQLIDAREFNASFPSTFPRFVQLAIWRYCSQSGRDICNGNRIDDRMRCDNEHCQLFQSCDRVPLNTQNN